MTDPSHQIKRGFELTILPLAFSVVYPFAVYALLGFEVAVLSTMGLILYLEITP